jgi:hypothetical protein
MRPRRFLLLLLLALSTALLLVPLLLPWRLAKPLRVWFLEPGGSSRV